MPQVIGKYVFICVYLWFNCMVTAQVCSARQGADQGPALQVELDLYGETYRI